MNITDVPCRSCELGYTRPHTCDAPDYCACDHPELHPHQEAPDLTGPGDDVLDFVTLPTQDARDLLALLRASTSGSLDPARRRSYGQERKRLMDALIEWGAS